MNSMRCYLGGRASINIQSGNKFQKILWSSKRFYQVLPGSTVTVWYADRSHGSLVRGTATLRLAWLPRVDSCSAPSGSAQKRNGPVYLLSPHLSVAKIEPTYLIYPSDVGDRDRPHTTWITEITISDAISYCPTVL